MKIIIVGLGKVGQTLVQELAGEGNDITIIDQKEDVVSDIASAYDVMGIVGNGAIYSTQIEAGIETADLLIAATTSDEMNLLCCLIAKKAGNCHTIARVRNPEYATELSFIKEELGLAMVINPEEAAANEIANSLKFPSAIEVNSFAKSKAELLKCRIPEKSPFAGKKLSSLFGQTAGKVLICAVERGEELIIPNGNTVIQAKDLISVVGEANEANIFFSQAGIVTNQVKSLMIVGGGSIGYYLAKTMSENGVKVKVIEQNRARCEVLCELLPKAAIICGNGTDRELLEEEGIERYEGFAALTGVDEENILISLHARKTGNKKIITKINRIAFDEVVQELELDTVIHPKNITSERIVRYVRSMKNSLDSNVETLHRIINGKAEALEFAITSASKVTNVPLQQLKIKEDVIVACITRDSKVINPRGNDMIEVGDSVVVVTKEKGLNNIEDILAK